MNAPDATRKAEQSWRGKAAESDAERTAAESTDDAATARLRRRSRELLISLVRPHRKRIGAVAALLTIHSAASLSGPVLVMYGIDEGVPALARDGDWGVLIAVAAAFAVATLAGFVAIRYSIDLIGQVSQAMLLDLRRRVYRHFQKLSAGFHERFTSGRVISRLTSDMDAIRELTDNGVDDLVQSVLHLIGITALLLWMDFHLALVALITMPLMLFLGNWFRVNSARMYRRTRETIALVIVYFVESMGGVRAVQANRRQRRNAQIFGGLNSDNRDSHVTAHRAAGVFAGGTKLIGNVTVAGVLLYGGYLAANGETTIGVLAAFLLLLRRFYEPIQELTMFYNSLQSATAALEKLAGVLHEKPDVAEPESPTPLPHARGELRLDRVSFAYRGGESVLENLDLHIPAGQTVALVGATGAGKTTTAKLLARFFDPNSGTVSLDGVDLKQLSEQDLRRATAMVTQENFLFNGTVGENIAFGRPEADAKQIAEAARAIGADEFIAQLPEGFDTDVHKRGGRLSAGQRQLVAFARAFLADPRVLILDEATSSLDIPSERLVQRALRTILADRTAVIIAHRLSTVEIADRVLVMEGGKVIEDGTPDSLIQSGGRYARLHRQWEDSLV